MHFCVQMPDTYPSPSPRMKWVRHDDTYFYTEEGQLKPVAYVPVGIVQSHGWTKFDSPERQGHFWWWREFTKTKFWEVNPAPWRRLRCPETNCLYWWLNEDDWFWDCCYGAGFDSKKTTFWELGPAPWRCLRCPETHRSFWWLNDDNWFWAE